MVGDGITKQLKTGGPHGRHIIMADLSVADEVWFFSGILLLSGNFLGGLRYGSRFCDQQKVMYCINLYKRKDASVYIQENYTFNFNHIQPLWIPSDGK